MKSLKVYYALFFLGGFLLGFHRFYLGFKWTGLVYALTAGFFGLLMVYDLLFAKRNIRKSIEGS